MYDSVNPLAIPADAPAIAGYDDGINSQWLLTAWARFKTKLVLHICTWGPRNLGDTLDIEAGDSVVADARPWALNALGRGVEHPKLYMSVSDFHAVLVATSDLDVRYWTAHYTNVPHLCGSQCNPRLTRSADATQWASSSSVTGGDFDLSHCLMRLFD